MKPGSENAGTVRAGASRVMGKTGTAGKGSAMLPDPGPSVRLRHMIGGPLLGAAEYRPLTAAEHRGLPRLVRVVASYVALRQWCLEFKGDCLSCGGEGALRVSPAAGTCRCHDCEVTHDAAGFVMAREGLDRRRAVKRLSSRAWKPLAPVLCLLRTMPPRKKPLRKKKLRTICGARNRRGEPCACRKVYRGARCRYHGGLSLTNADRERITKETGRTFLRPGPRTPEGKARALRNLALRWRGQEARDAA